MYIAVPPPYKHKQKQDVPAKVLELDYSYGYNGLIPENLSVTDDGLLVYGLAGVVVVLNPANLEQSFFNQHSEDVTCVARNPTNSIIASGQRDPKDNQIGEDKPYVCIWDSKTKEEVKRISNYCSRAVASVGFTYDGKYIFVVGDDDNKTGGLFEWEKNCKKPILESMCSKDQVYGQSHAPELLKGRYQWLTYGVKTLKWWSVKPDEEDREKQVKTIIPGTFQTTKITQKFFSCVAWSAAGHALVGTHSGHVYVISKDNYKVKSWYALGKAVIKSISLCTGSLPEGAEDAEYRVIDSKGNSYYVSAKHKELKKVSFKSHGVVQAAVDVNDITYIGTKNCNLMEVNLQQPDECKTILHGHNKEIWCLATHPTQPWVCIGCDDKKMRVWDWNTKAIKFAKKKYGYRCGDFSSCGKYLALGCTDGSLVVIDCHNPEGDFVYEKKICQEEVAAVAFSKCSKKIVVGSWDQHLRVIIIGKKWKVKTMKGHTSSVTHVCISEDSALVQSDSKDNQKLLWDLTTYKRINEIPADTVWNRWNCILGWPVQGLFWNAETTDDVNCCEISGSNEIDDEKGTKVVASGDDTGHVNLYKYPILEEEPKCDQYTGHSAHVTNTRFSSDGKLLFSSGGGDLAVFQWKVLDRE